jgi:uncharacterized metal-binding protein YceD (DUF177 family)
LITISQSSRPVHEEGECNEEMVKLIEKYQMNPAEKKENKDDDDIDPRWSALKNLN